MLLMLSGPQEVDYYITPAGQVPFANWFDALADERAQARIDTRLARLRGGNLGEWSSIGSGVIELKIDYGPGYRVYLGRAGLAFILLLCGGTKRTQDADIKLALSYW